MCSVAIHKMYQEWKKEGYQIPPHLLTLENRGKKEGVGVVVTDLDDVEKDGRGVAKSLKELDKERERETGGISRDNLSFKYVDLASGSVSADPGTSSAPSSSRQNSFSRYGTAAQCSAFNQLDKSQQAAVDQMVRQIYKPSQPMQAVKQSKSQKSQHEPRHQDYYKNYFRPPLPPGPPPPK